MQFLLLQDLVNSQISTMYIYYIVSVCPFDDPFSSFHHIKIQFTLFASQLFAITYLSCTSSGWLWWPRRWLDHLSSASMSWNVDLSSDHIPTMSPLHICKQHLKFTKIEPLKNTKIKSHRLC